MHTIARCQSVVIDRHTRIRVEFPMHCVSMRNDAERNQLARDYKTHLDGFAAVLLGVFLEARR